MHRYCGAGRGRVLSALLSYFLFNVSIFFVFLSVYTLEGFSSDLFANHTSLYPAELLKHCFQFIILLCEKVKLPIIINIHVPEQSWFFEDSMYTEGHYTILNYFKLVKYELLDSRNSDSEMNQFHMTGNIKSQSFCT